MYLEPIFLIPVFKERIWGGSKLETEYNYDIPNERTGECWGISAHPNGACEIANGALKGYSLDRVWNDNRELFGNLEGEEFPLLVKIIDANEDLSVQVHPNDEYAKRVENSQFGKTECWYIIDCEEGAEIIFGHNAKTKEEFQHLVDEKKWDYLLRKVKVKPGDFFYVPSGTVHAIGKGILILETQQSSDVTYRLYDYDRKDKDGNLRELHIKDSINVTNVPDVSSSTESKKVSKYGGLTSTELIVEDYFTVYQWDLAEEANLELNDPFLLISVLEGNGQVEINNSKYSFTKGDHFILPSTIKEYSLLGEAKFIVSRPS